MPEFNSLKSAADDFDSQLAAAAFEKEYIFKQLNSNYLDAEGLFYDGLHLKTSTDLEAAQEYIQPGDLGVWYFFTGEAAAPIENYFLSGVETLTFDYTSTLQYLEIRYSTDEGNKLDARFGSDKQPADAIASSIKDLAEQMLTSGMHKTSLNPTIKVRNFKADQLSIFTSNTISETEATSTTALTSGGAKFGGASDTFSDAGTPDFSDGANQGDFGEPSALEASTEVPAEFGDSYDYVFDFSDGGGNK